MFKRAGFGAKWYTYYWWTFENLHDEVTEKYDLESLPIENTFKTQKLNQSSSSIPRLQYFSIFHWNTAGLTPPHFLNISMDTQ